MTALDAVQDIVVELDRQITRAMRHIAQRQERTVADVLASAKLIRDLVDARALFVHYGHRAVRLAKGAEVEVDETPDPAPGAPPLPAARVRDSRRRSG